ncbi:hypothetical protein B0H21DRAFT_733083 [Amylocystis lapponica]|nr:hypothetical protein B0H21DRAFT_733083 [Amylocystis lapponica]
MSTDSPVHGSGMVPRLVRSVVAAPVAASQWHGVKRKNLCEDDNDEDPGRGEKPKRYKKRSRFNVTLQEPEYSLLYSVGSPLFCAVTQLAGDLDELSPPNIIQQARLVQEVLNTTFDLHAEHFAISEELFEAAERFLQRDDTLLNHDNPEFDTSSNDDNTQVKEGQEVIVNREQADLEARESIIPPIAREHPTEEWLWKRACTCRINKIIWAYGAEAVNETLEQEVRLSSEKDRLELHESGYTAQNSVMAAVVKSDDDDEDEPQHNTHDPDRDIELEDEGDDGLYSGVNLENAHHNFANHYMERADTPIVAGDFDFLAMAHPPKDALMDETSSFDDEVEWNPSEASEESDDEPFKLPTELNRSRNPSPSPEIETADPSLPLELPRLSRVWADDLADRPAMQMRGTPRVPTGQQAQGTLPRRVATSKPSTSIPRYWINWPPRTLLSRRLAEEAVYLASDISGRTAPSSDSLS